MRTMTNNTNKNAEKTLQNETKHQSDHSESSQPTISTGLNIGVLLATLIFPIVGIVMGFTYLRKGHASTTKAGKTWLIAGTLMLFAQIILINISRPN